MTDTTQGQPPAGWTWANFKAVSLESGQWVWGAVQGSFNARMSTSQIIVDTVIGCIPLVGDATAVRDLIAISIGLCEDPKKREDVWEWALFGVLVLALIPVFGGVIKGVGRLVIRFARDTAKLAGAARAAKLAEAAKNIIAVLNHFKFKGSAEAWFLKLRFARYKDDMLRAADQFSGRMADALDAIKAKLGSVLPDGMLKRIDALKQAMAWLRVEFRKHVPEVIQQLDAHLRELQSYVRAGGETTSRTVAHEVATGERNITYTQEARLLEDGPLPVRSARGGFVQNPANINKPRKIAKYYKHEPGYPDLLSRPDKKTGHVSTVAAYNGKVMNRPLHDGEGAYRIFGPGQRVRGVQVDDAYPFGNWWGMGDAPHNAEEWRIHAGVLDEFNSDGYIVTARVRDGDKLKACIGHVSEQVGVKIPGQYLPGSNTLQQAFVLMPDETRLFLKKAGRRVVSGKGAMVHWSDKASGLDFEVRPTGWTDANGFHGYADGPSAGTVSTQALGEREVADRHYKDNAR